MSSNVCQICCDKECEISCFNCNYKTCKICTGMYLLNIINEPNCANCKTKWTNIFLYENFPSKFIKNDLREHRKNSLYDRELSMLKETQEEASKIKKVKDITTELKDLTMQTRILKNKASKLRKKKKKLLDRKDLNIKRVIKQSNLILCNCPNEDCKGFVNIYHICTMCDTEICKNCYEILEDEHICDENDTKSIKKIKKDTKSCPGCNCNITKIEGCYQMWCTQCHTAFNWNTKEIVDQNTQYIHNPHYIQWRNENGSEPVLPRRLINVRFTNFYNLMKNYHKIEICHFYENFNNFLNHVEDVELIKYTTEGIFDRYKHLRIKYLLNELEEEIFKNRIHQNEKKIHKYSDIFLVYENFIQVGRELLQSIFGKGNVITGDVYEDCVKNGEKKIRKLISTINEDIFKLEKVYYNKIPIIVYNKRELSVNKTKKIVIIDFVLN